jgi:hypothetical protein
VADLNHWLTEYPMLAGIAFGAVVLVILVVVLDVLMRRSGMSRKPLVWFVVLMGLVAGPQAVVHVLDVVAFERQRIEVAPASHEQVPVRPAAAPASLLQPVPWEAVLGPQPDPALMVDPRIGLAAVLGTAEEARLSFTRTGASALAARFASPAAAAEALRAYVTFFQFAAATGNAAVGWTGRRYGMSEWNHVVAAEHELYAWTGPDRDSVISRRESALGPLDDLGHAPAVLPPVAPEPFQHTRAARAHEVRLVSDNLSLGVMVPLVAGNVLAVVLWFLRGAAWAARVAPAGSVKPMPAAEVRRRLVAAYGTDSPISATERPDGGVVLDWKWADARWLDLMRVHRMKRTHRLVLVPDEAARTVRVREYWSAFDASAGAGGVRAHWRAATGIEFFRVEQQRILGAVLDGAGRPAGELHRTYRFDSGAMKRPAIDAVTGAGWRWQPTLYNGPAWLRWLTG